MWADIIRDALASLTGECMPLDECKACGFPIGETRALIISGNRFICAEGHTARLIVPHALDLWPVMHSPLDFRVIALGGIPLGTLTRGLGVSVVRVGSDLVSVDSDRGAWVDAAMNLWGLE